VEHAYTEQSEDYEIVTFVRTRQILRVLYRYAIRINTLLCRYICKRPRYAHSICSMHDLPQRPVKHRTFATSMLQSLSYCSYLYRDTYAEDAVH
jgi:hypothetical protein